MITITVHGNPAAQGSKRAFVPRGSTRPVVTEMAGQKLKSWREAVRSEAQDAIEVGAEPILDGPVDLTIDLWMPRPKSHYRTGKRSAELRHDAPAWVAQTPDLDKCLRAVLDALTDAGVWRDDRQVASIHATQRYGSGSPGADISVRPLP